MQICVTCKRNNKILDKNKLLFRSSSQNSAVHIRRDGFERGSTSDRALCCGGGGRPLNVTLVTPWETLGTRHASISGPNRRKISHP